MLSFFVCVGPSMSSFGGRPSGKLILPGSQLVIFVLIRVFESSSIRISTKIGGFIGSLPFTFPLKPKKPTLPLSGVFGFENFDFGAEFLNFIHLTGSSKLTGCTM